MWNVRESKIDLKEPTQKYALAQPFLQLNEYSYFIVF